MENGIVYENVPRKLAQILVGVSGNSYVMLFLIILMLAFCGMFVETTVIALLMTPILLPVVQSVGIDPVHFGVLMMTVVTGGIMTPPVGIALYTTSEIMECKPQETASVSEKRQRWFSLAIGKILQRSNRKFTISL